MESFFGFLFPILAFDYIPMDDLYQLFEGPVYDPHNIHFEALGYESKQMIVNMGSVFIVIVPTLIFITAAMTCFKRNRCKNQYGCSKA